MPELQKIALLLTVCAGLSSPAYSAPSADALRLKEDKQQVKQWNQFAADLYELHKQQLKNRQVRTQERIGGYAGYLGAEDFYREVSYYDADTNRLLSRIQWEKESPETIHVIEVFLYDQRGALALDYLAAYLPVFRNAPIQTLINVHDQTGGLRAFRQFDASGERIFERCEGEHLNGPVNLFIDNPQELSDRRIFRTEAYVACFAQLPIEAGAYLEPLSHLKRVADTPTPTVDVARDISPDAVAHLQAGKTHLENQQLEAAISAFNKAIKADPQLDEAWLMRGMARGRNRQIEQGIADISVYIERNPNSSYAYTKRGVRRIWLGDMAGAEQDLKRAIALNPGDAEAYDDLGVIYAQRGDYAEALNHFSRVIQIDPTYQKGHHNMALTYFLTGDQQPALTAIERAIALDDRNRASVLLKAEIVAALGRDAEAAQLRDYAEQLPHGNWSERAEIR